MLLYDAPARAPEALRPHHGAPAALMQNLLPAGQVLLSQPLSQARAHADVDGQLGLEKGAHFEAKRLLFGGVFQVHAGFSMLIYGTVRSGTPCFRRQLIDRRRQFIGPQSRAAAEPLFVHSMTT